MSSAHLSNTVPPQGHILSRSTGIEVIEQGLPRSFANLAESDLRREESSRDLLSIDQSSNSRPPPMSLERTSLLRSNEVSSLPVQAPATPRTSDGISHSTFVQPRRRPSVSDEPLPRRVLCDNCDEWIITKDSDDNENGNWAEHVAVCGYSRPTREGSASLAGDVSTSISVTPAPAADFGELRDTNTAFRRRKVKHYETERLALLRRDPQAEEVEEYRVLCGFCEKWIQLRKDRPYCPIAWTAHKLQCVNRRRKPGPIPKKLKREYFTTSVISIPEVPSPQVQIRRTEEERLRFLESDPHATTVEPHRVLCAICRRWIQLRKNSTYCTAPWVQHVRKCAIKHEVPRKTNGIAGTYGLDDDGEDEVESEDDTPSRHRSDPMPKPTKRRRGRPRKHNLVEPIKNGQLSFTLRPVSGGSPSPSNNQRDSSRFSVSPPPMRTPSPPPAHPYPNDMYWYPTLPPMSSYYPLYAGSQYNEGDDSYSLYFHAQQPANQSGPTAGQGRSRTKSQKQLHLNPGGFPTSSAWHSGPSSTSGPPGSTPHSGSTGSPAPDATSPQSGRAWIVWRLKDYSTNPCPMDPVGTPTAHTSAPSEASGSGSGSDHLPMFRSGTWPHLLDPEDSGPQQKLSPYVHSELGHESGSGESSAHGAATHFSQLAPPPPPPSLRPSAEDPTSVTFNSGAHIPVKKNEAYVSPEPKMDPRLSTHSSSTAVIPPGPPTGADLDSAECRLAFTFQAIAYLFSTSFQGADDMSLETLMSFMNRTIPHDKMYDGQEVSQHVAILGERKQLVFTKEGGVQLLTSPPP